MTSDSAASLPQPDQLRALADDCGLNIPHEIPEALRSAADALKRAERQLAEADAAFTRIVDVCQGKGGVVLCPSRISIVEGIADGMRHASRVRAPQPQTRE